MPGATFVPALEGKRPLYVLVIGSDARPGQGIDKERADSIHIISLNAAAGRATVLGIPRDSWVSIPGHGMDKINASLSYGGPKLTVKTVSALTGIHFDFYAITSFGGLVRMVQSLGGVTVARPPADARPVLALQLRARHPPLQRGARRSSTRATGTASSAATSPARRTRGP